MKKIIAAILALCIVGGSLPKVYSDTPKYTITASAEGEYEEVTEGSLTYLVYENHAVLAQCDENAEGEIIIPEKFNGVPVTSIADHAFQNCESLTSIKIPDSITSIEDGTFFECISLESINIPDSVTIIGDEAFCGCSSLKSITIPDSVTGIDSEAFRACSSLESITLPDSVEGIGGAAFCGCSSLESITILDPYCNISYGANTISNGCDEENNDYFNGTIYGYKDSSAQEYAEKYGYKFESIGGAAFEGEFKDGNLTYQVYEDHAEVIKCDKDAEGELIIPDMVKDVPVTSIGIEAFRGIENLTSIIIPDSVTSIGDYTFADCSNLESVTLPDSITSIGYYLFGNCSSLASIRIPDSVTKIDNLAFYECSSLKSVEFPSTLTDINGQAFNKTPWMDAQREKSPFVIVNGALVNGQTCSGDIIIPDNVTIICDCAFISCEDITSAVVPATVIKVSSSFENCKNLATITFMNPECEIPLSRGVVSTYLDWGEAVPTAKFTGTIRGYDNSTAQAYAENYGYKFESLGAAPAFVGEFKDGALTYQVYEDHAEVTKCDEDAEGEITVPDKIKGVPVTIIDMSAFAGCTSLKSVTIPDSVTQISDAAFSNCADLISITFLNPNCDIPNTPSAISNGYDMDKNEQYYSGTIRGYDDSTAQAYAEKRGYIFESLGAAPISDSKYKNLGKITDDDKISVADAADVLKECASLSKGTPNYSEEKKRNADLDFNTKITVNDASLVLRYSAYLAKGPKDVMDCKTWLASVGVLPDEEKK